MKLINLLGICLMVTSITFFFGIVIAFVLFFYAGWSGLLSSIAGFGLAFVISLVLIATDSKTRINHPLPSEGRWFI